MTEYQKARRARKSAAFFARHARKAKAAGNPTEAARLTRWAVAKGEQHKAAQAKASAPARRVVPCFHQRMMHALDHAQRSGAYLTDAHRAMRRALRERNMRGQVFTSPEELGAAVRAFAPEQQAAVMALAA